MTPKNLPSRNIRVSDELWGEAMRAAKSQNTTVSALVNRFLTDYVRAVLAWQQPQRRFKTNKVPKFINKHRSFVDMPPNNRIVGRPIDPKRCKHIRILKVTFGTFCKDCGLMIEVDPEATRFLETLAGELQPDWGDDQESNSGLSSSDDTTTG